MKLFICNRTIENQEVESLIDDLLKVSENTFAIQRETEHSDNWKNIVEQKMKESDFIVFAIGKETFQSDQVKWEYAKAKKLNKQIIGIKLNEITEDSILFCQGFQVFDNAKQSFKFLTKTYEDDRKLKFEQYKMMVSSTEKVTDQRLKVNNLFFTVTSSILSIGFILAKAFEFSTFGVIGMLFMTIMAFIVSFFWAKLINSYGTLNTGKFKVIDKIEKQLRTNMFEDEWQILKEIGYEPNSQTEIKVIKRFRVFIIVLAMFQIGYLLYEIYPLLNSCNLKQTIW
ncbi:MAG: TIR domain-containing protein [Algoriphagus sp.]|uniref:RipA family octameric membrane protein n=1 Tax=Algoriphagus sp. TaxID=1872435 RepID=UPI001803B156|nr:TIR domain-containing protein [Algoriphagus sp.]NVJ86483.1 TIR domain-containing protein [Algoriphagus sp.]